MSDPAARLVLETGDGRWEVDLERGASLAIEMGGGRPLPAFFVPGTLHQETLAVGGFTGDTRAGGSCNVSRLDLVPHCHGTHTEGVGHVTDQQAAVQDLFDGRPALAWLATVSAVPAGDCSDAYHCPLADTEPLVTRKALSEALDGCPAEATALVLRVRPLDAPLPVRDFNTQPGYPLLSAPAMDWLAARPFAHLLVEMPSLDRAQDGGRLGNHRAWWGLPAQGRDMHEARHPGRVVTEMISVPDTLTDGLYWLHPGLSPLHGDATPSRPQLFPLRSPAPDR